MGKTFTIKPLEWHGIKGGGWVAMTIFGPFEVWESADGNAYCDCLRSDIGVYASVGYAKEHCEAEWQPRIESALIEVKS